MFGGGFRGFPFGFQGEDGDEDGELILSQVQDQEVVPKKLTTRSFMMF